MGMESHQATYSELHDYCLAAASWCRQDDIVIGVEGYREAFGLHRIEYGERKERMESVLELGRWHEAYALDD